MLAEGFKSPTEAALTMVRERIAAHDGSFGWRRFSEERLGYRYENLCQVRQGKRQAPPRVLLALVREAKRAGVDSEVLDILLEDSESQRYSQPASSPSGRVSPRDWVQRRARKASRY